MKKADGSEVKALINGKTRDAHKNVLVHVRKGCFADPDGDIEYKGPDGKTYKYRGSSQNEALHRVLNSVKPSSHLSPMPAHCLLFDILFHYTVRFPLVVF